MGQAPVRQSSHRGCGGWTETDGWAGAATLAGLMIFFGPSPSVAAGAATLGWMMERRWRSSTRQLKISNSKLKNGRGGLRELRELTQIKSWIDGFWDGWMNGGVAGFAGAEEAVNWGMGWPQKGSKMRRWVDFYLWPGPPAAFGCRGGTKTRRRGWDRRGHAEYGRSRTQGTGARFEQPKQ